MPTLTVVTGTRRISAANGGMWVRPRLAGGNWIINFGAGGSRDNGSVLTVWQRLSADAAKSGAAGTEQVVTTIDAAAGTFAETAAADPNMEYDMGCDTGGAFVAGDTPVAILGWE